MSTMNSVSDQTLREEVQQWLSENWHDALAEELRNEAYGWETSAARKEWLGKVLESRWAVPRWAPVWPVGLRRPRSGRPGSGRAWRSSRRS